MALPRVDALDNLSCNAPEVEAVFHAELLQSRACMSGCQLATDIAANLLRIGRATPGGQRHREQQHEYESVPDTRPFSRHVHRAESFLLARIAVELDALVRDGPFPSASSLWPLLASMQ